MSRDANLSLPAMARLVAECLERLDLRDVTLVSNDWGGAQLLLSEVREPGQWLLHCHVPHHTTNDNTEQEGGGGLMLVINVTP
jgi:hypothetical protein